MSGQRFCLISGTGRRCFDNSGGFDVRLEERDKLKQVGYDLDVRSSNEHLKRLLSTTLVWLA